MVGAPLHDVPCPLEAKAKANMVPPGRHVTASAKSMGGPPSTAAATGPAPRQVGKWVISVEKMS